MGDDDGDLDEDLDGDRDIVSEHFHFYSGMFSVLPGVKMETLSYTSVSFLLCWLKYSGGFHLLVVLVVGSDRGRGMRERC